MDFNEFRDRLFDALNETDFLPIEDINADDKENSIKIILSDGSAFQIQCSEYK